jgi:hypothetical protein
MGEAGIPAGEVSGQVVVEDPGADPTYGHLLGVCYPRLLHRPGLPVVSAEIPTIFPFTQVTTLQSTFAHPTRTMSIEPSDLRKRCKSMVFR